MTDLSNLTGAAYSEALHAGHLEWLRKNRLSFRSRILGLVSVMAKMHPGCDWSTARDAFGLIGKVKEVTGSPDFLTALTGIGLSREQIKDEYAFAQGDIAQRAAATA